MAVHFLDLLPWICGLDFVEIFASSHPDRRGSEADDTVTILGTLNGGCQAVMRASREIPFGENDLVIEGTKGMLATSGFRRADEYILRITNAGGTAEERFPPTPAYQREIEAFEREIRGERSVLPTGEDGVRIIQLASAVLQSIQTRQSIAV
jgi:predicted dehydrogenase